ncbi:MAG: ethanolamine ammonia-lyase subunit EutB [Syntrophaceae bacterium]|jgi:ethanolamine ammonia-lyase large subunit|nr:ethanolamine ammonia-lyase subunit EutB [Syntrophaceae bacterium]
MKDTDTPPETGEHLSRREFCGFLAGSLAVSALLPPFLQTALAETTDREDLFAFMNRTLGRFDRPAYQKLIGAANAFKEGDEILGVAAADEAMRSRARRLLANTKLGDILNHPLFEDDLYACLVRNLSPSAVRKTSPMTLGELKAFLLSAPETDIPPILGGLCSDVIGCVVKLMTDEELTAAGSRIFHPLAGTKIGAKGYLSARIQPNSPTDHPDDVIWQIFSGWSYATGDVVLGTNPVSSLEPSVAALEAALADIRRTFGVEDLLPHSVLAHIDIQAAVEKLHPQTTGVWFQSLAGSDLANATFDITLDKMLAYAARRTGQYGFYFETGQGADFTNGSGQNTDMVIHEARKYGFARLLKSKVAEAQVKAGRPAAPWVHVNDVAGFIGPEVFRTREQLVRCCLEDIVMGKLHGLTIGLDICSTLHMDISLDDLDWCQDRIIPANPAYLMALPTKNDPMLGYLTTAFQDHVRLREKFGYKVNDAMERFFQRLGVIDASGKPTSHFGQPLWIWHQYRRAKGDRRPQAEIRREGQRKMKEVRARGVYLAEGFDGRPWKMAPGLDREIRDLYADAKKSIWVELPPSFVASLPNAVPLKTRSQDRTDYILHPQTGEELDDASRRTLLALREKRNPALQVQIIVSDGLNAYAIMDSGHLAPYLAALEKYLRAGKLRAAPEILVLRGGRVRAGYRIGETLFGQSSDAQSHKGIVHLIGERPGTMHHTFSAYITAPAASVWAKGGIDHNITRVVSGIADTALKPISAAKETAGLLAALWKA